MNCIKTVSLAKEIGQARMWVLSVLVMLLYFLVFYTMFQTFGSQAALQEAGFFYTILLLMLILPLHLVLHCLPVWAAGKKAKFGFRRSQWPFLFYSVKEPVPRTLSLVSTLFPAAVLTLTAFAAAALLPAYTHVIGIVSAFHFGLCTYDFFTARQMFAAPKECLIEDNRSGFHIVQPIREIESTGTE
ncbi:DUF3267 domain-containing protein [Bacillus daqingensis]|uniref:DUF3267 domain-containing protein n=1 Tax=Bacillus daqingensis TaxID=872396 RepID=A0ABV9NY49_9BACI